MKRGFLWTVLFIFHCLFFIAFYKSIHYISCLFLSEERENMTAVFILPVFYWIVLGIMSGFLLITGLTGIKYLKNTIMSPADVFLHTKDMISVKVLKILCYLWEAAVLWLIYLSVLSGDLWGVLAYLLLFFIDAFYIIWFSSVLHMEKRRNDYSL